MELLGLPRQGHLYCIKSLSGYYLKNSDVPGSEGDWPKTIHGDLEELMPYDHPEPQGWFVTSTKYLESNLKHQALLATIDTAAYVSVFVSAWNCIRKIIDLPNMQRYLGDPIRAKSHMLGDVKSVVDGSMQVYAKLHKQHTILSIHQLLPKWLDSSSSQEIKSLLYF
jgi:hypothetical protein